MAQRTLRAAGVQAPNRASVTEYIDPHVAAAHWTAVEPFSYSRIFTADAAVRIVRLIRRDARDPGRFIRTIWGVLIAGTLFGRAWCGSQVS
jgi:hypothetical protein